MLTCLLDGSLPPAMEPSHHQEPENSTALDAPTLSGASTLADAACCVPAKHGSTGEPTCSFVDNVGPPDVDLSWSPVVLTPTPSHQSRTGSEVSPATQDDAVRTGTILALIRAIELRLAVPDIFLRDRDGVEEERTGVERSRTILEGALLKTPDTFMGEAFRSPLEAKPLADRSEAAAVHKEGPTGNKPSELLNADVTPTKQRTSGSPRSLSSPEDISSLDDGSPPYISAERSAERNGNIVSLRELAVVSKLSVTITDGSVSLFKNPARRSVGVQTMPCPPEAEPPSVIALTNGKHVTSDTVHVPKLFRVVSNLSTRGTREGATLRLPAVANRRVDTAVLSSPDIQPPRAYESFPPVPRDQLPSAKQSFRTPREDKTGDILQDPHVANAVDEASSAPEKLGSPPLSGTSPKAALESVSEYETPPSVTLPQSGTVMAASRGTTLKKEVTAHDENLTHQIALRSPGSSAATPSTNLSDEHHQKAKDNREKQTTEEEHQDYVEDHGGSVLSETPSGNVLPESPPVPHKPPAKRRKSKDGIIIESVEADMTPSREVIEVVLKESQDSLVKVGIPPDEGPDNLPVVVPEERIKGTAKPILVIILAIGVLLALAAVIGYYSSEEVQSTAETTSIEPERNGERNESLVNVTLNMTLKEVDVWVMGDVLDV